MSFNIYNQSQEQNNTANLRSTDDLHIHKQTKHKRLILNLICNKHYVAYTTEELRAVKLLGETPIVGLLSRRNYKKHLAQKERIKQFLEQEKSEKQNKEQSL